MICKFEHDESGKWVICVTCARRMPRMGDAPLDTYRAPCYPERRVRNLKRKWMLVAPHVVTVGKIVILPPQPLCAFLGPPTGKTHKRRCSGGAVAEHVCYNVDRRLWLNRSGRWSDGLCTPKGRCQDAEFGIQPCQTCPLRVPQRMLAS